MKSTVLVVAVVDLLFVSALMPRADAQTNGAAISVTQYAVPTPSSNPYDITVGPDGALWFTEADTFTIGRATTSGAITEFPGLALPPLTITTGSDGDLWFALDNSQGANGLGRMTTAGELIEYTLPLAFPGPTGITSGPDGAIWFTAGGLNEIGRITTSGAITYYPIPSPPFSGPNGITNGPDGALWFTEGTNFSNQYEIERIATDGTFTVFDLPATSQAAGITTGPDGALWFTEFNVQKIGRITTSGVLTEYPLQTVKPNSLFITPGADGAVWFTEKSGHVGRITTSGVVTEYPTARGSGPTGIVAGPNGHSLWFTEAYSGNIATVPDCGLGLRLSYSNGTIDAGFALGTVLPATFNVSLTANGVTQAVLAKSVPAIVPPKTLTLPITEGVPASGTAEVKSSLSVTRGGYCQEYQTITIN
jgi:virginiamycin B lyase